MRKTLSKALAALLCLCMLFSILPMSAFAVEYNADFDDYYNVISKQDWELAPGITESEIVLNSDAGTHRQVAHVVEADISNEYVKVMPSYAGMKEALDEQNFQTQIMSEQTEWAEANGYGNIVAAMNVSLSWYDSTYYKENPELVGEPLGYLVMDGNYYENSKGKTAGAKTCVVINFDEKDGEARPEDMPKVQIRSTEDDITGWEEQVIPVNFSFLVKDGENLYSKDNDASNGASRSFVGIKADGTIVTVMNDGRQAPFSTGFTSYEMAQFMISLGCVVAVNGDGGGSSTFLSQRPGEEMELHCSPSDGSERPTTHGIFFITTAPSTGEFVRASITSEDTYYTPGSTVKFAAVGSDIVGTAAQIPDDAVWQIKEDGMGTIENGVFVSNGTTGTVTAQLVCDGKVVGEHSVEIVVPTAFNFQQTTMTVPFGKEVKINLIATVNDGLNEVVLKDGDVEFTLDNAALGTINGFYFTAAEEANVPETLSGVLTATLTCAGLTVTSNVVLGKGSEVIEGFETDMTWNGGNFRDYPGVKVELKHENATTGQVHSGNGSASFNLNALRSANITNNGYNQMGIYLPHSMIIENAKSIGIWVYLPEDYYNFGIYITYFYDSDGDGTYDKRNAGVTLADQPYVYNNVEESGWHYFSTDVSAYDSILLNGPDIASTLTGYNSARGDGMNFRFLEIRSTHTSANSLFKSLGGLNGNFTVYLDDLTVDYSEAVEDREAPEFGDVTLITNNEAEHTMVKRSYITIDQNNLDIVANVAENSEKTNATGLNSASAKAYIDGVEVNTKFANGRMFISDAVVADGMHRVKFEICDNAGNKSSVIRLVNVQSGVEASTVKVEPKDATLDRLYGGSVYWMDIKATDIETIQSVETIIDLNNVNDWELEHMEIAEGFTASYTIDEVPNTATITITRTGENTQEGEVVLASLPIRVIYFDDDIYAAESMITGSGTAHTAQTYWESFSFWCQNVCVDVDYGKITYVDGYDPKTLGVFSNEEFVVDTEMYTVSSSMDQTFKTERGTCHVHTAVTLDDKAATCTEYGYTDRTYCEVCDSVVDWGTTVPATGHSYVLVDGKVVCECGAEKKIGTGFFTLGDSTYYAIGGNIQSGWRVIGSDYYYFDLENYAMYTGACRISGQNYVFNDEGVLIQGEWVERNGERVYHWGGDRVKRQFFEIDGKTYYFNKEGYALRGYQAVQLVDYAKLTYFHFDEETGELLERFENGIAVYDGKTVYFKDGQLYYAGLVQEGDDFYYIRSNGYAATGRYYVTTTNGLKSEGYYVFGEDGKLLVKNGVYDGMYYENDEVVPGKGLVKIGEDYYYVRSNGYVATGRYYVTNNNGLLASRWYDFAEDGKMLLKNGVVDGKYYVNDILTAAGLVKIGDDYYYVRSNGCVATGRYYVSNNNGLLDSRWYDFAEDGKMLLKNGVIDGVYYVNDVITAAGLIKIGNDYYYVRGNGKVATGRYYVTTNNGLLPSDYYVFDDDGKMLIKNGIVDGVYYVNDVVTGAGLIEIDGDYYYIRSNGKVATGRYYVTTNNGLMPSGYYNFAEDGKMIR